IARLRDVNLPLPKTNKPAGSKRVDCRWPGLTVELISYQFHNSRYSWEQDLERERQAYDRGDRFRRYSWKDVTENPTRMLNELRQLLLTPTAPSRPRRTPRRLAARSAARARS